MRSKESDRSSAIKKLKSDIRNAGRHVLGVHDNCSTDFCKYNDASKKDKDTLERQEDSEDVISSLCNYWKDATCDLTETQIMELRCGGTDSYAVKQKEQLLNDLYFYLNRLSEKTTRLIGNFTSNLAECWMSVRCKFDGGKMVNRCFRGSFYARCYGGALRTMLGPAWSPQVYSKVSGKVPDTVYIETYRQRSVQYKNSKKANQNPKNVLRRKQRKLKSSTECSTKKSKQAYGENVLIDTQDISKEQLQA